MHLKQTTIFMTVACLVFTSCGLANEAVQLGPRPYFLISDMSEGELKATLEVYQNGPFMKSDFSIGHRSACLQFPEHTKESYIAAARMGAGIVECDVTFTKDRVLVCRHSQCDLHTTTNILLIPELAAKCSQPFTPAVYDANGVMISPASAKCCTSDITLEEFCMLKGKMDGADRTATTVEQYVKGTADWRTDLYDGSGTLMTHAESIELFKQLGVKMTPELKNRGVNIIAPPMWMLLAVDKNDKIVPSEYAKAAGEAGLAIITWTFERTDTRDGAAGDWYYQTTGHVIEKDGDKMEVLDVLAQQVGVIGVFSDCPAAVTYYANTMGLGIPDQD